MAYKFNMEFQKSDEGALFLFHFFKKFWPDRFDTPPYPNFRTKIPYTDFGQLFQKIDSVLLQFWVEYGFWFRESKV